MRLACVRGHPTPTPNSKILSAPLNKINLRLLSHIVPINPPGEGHRNKPQKLLSHFIATHHPSLHTSLHREFFTLQAQTCSALTLAVACTFNLPDVKP